MLAKYSYTPPSLVAVAAPVGLEPQLKQQLEPQIKINAAEIKMAAAIKNTGLLLAFLLGAVLDNFDFSVLGSLDVFLGMVN